jgi:hypothetical protein
MLSCNKAFARQRQFFRHLQNAQKLSIEMVSDFLTISVGVDIENSSNSKVNDADEESMDSCVEFYRKLYNPLPHRIENLLNHCPTARRILFSKIGDEIAVFSDKKLEDSSYRLKKSYKQKAAKEKRKQNWIKWIKIVVFLLIFVFSFMYILNSCKMEVHENVSVSQECADGFYFKNSTCQKLPVENIEDCIHCRNCFEFLENKLLECNEETSNEETG